MSEVTDNRTILEKADLALSDLTTAGVLQPAQAKEFLKIMIKQSEILSECTVVPMKSPKQLIETMKFGQRILYAGTEAQALPSAQRQKPQLAKNELSAVLYKAEVRLDNEVLEDSIEQGKFKETVMEHMSEAISRDLEDVIINGDTASADPFYATIDGILKMATSNVVNANAITVFREIWRNMLRTMPSEFIKNKKALRFYTGVQPELGYRDELATRQTPGGDEWIAMDIAPTYGGVPVKGIQMFPENLGGGLDKSAAILTDPKNINVGIWRNIKIESDKLVSEGVMLLVATLRADVVYAHEPAVVKATNVKLT